MDFLSSGYCLRALWRGVSARAKPERGGDRRAWKVIDEEPRSCRPQSHGLTNRSALRLRLRRRARLRPRALCPAVPTPLGLCPGRPSPPGRERPRKIILDYLFPFMVLCRRPLRRGAACAPGSRCGGEAVPRRALGGVRLGRPLRLQGCSEGRRKAPDGKSPKTSAPGHYEQGAPIGR